MPSRRRKSVAHKMTAQAAPEAIGEEEKPPEDVLVKRAPVTQVVEVVEDDIQPSVPEVHSVEESPPVVEEQRREDATRKSMVEELYTTEKKPEVMPEISVHKNRPLASLFVWALVTIIVALVTGGILFAVAKKTSPITLFARPTPMPTVTPTSAPTPTLAAIDKSSFEIHVLNGGGTAGAAGKMKTFLEEKGYTVSGTGNTDEYTYASTEIHGKATMKDVIVNLQADLKETYTLGTVAADLSSSASAAVEVIVGK